MGTRYQCDKLYTGEEKIVIAYDIGTTMSAVSFCHLTKNSFPWVEMVTNWPGQARGSGGSKIPTLVAYDGTRNVACGEEALKHLDSDTVRVAKLFKLHLHPETIKTGLQSLAIPPLPYGVSITKVYADIISYLFSHTRSYFEERGGGSIVWSRLRDSMEFIFAIPNGWNYIQHQTLRQAAIDAGLFPSWKANSQLQFITEAEASVHFALTYGTTKGWMSSGEVFGVIDAGGSTTDSTLYTCSSVYPDMVLREAGAGGVTVDDGFRSMLRNKLRNSDYEDEETVETIVTNYEPKTKRLFDGVMDRNVVQFGGPRDTDRNLGIFKGKISLTTSEMVIAFNETVSKILASVRRLVSKSTPKYLLVVGGFGESPYLQKRLKDEFGSRGISFIICPDQATKKAAAEGAAIWYLKKLVKSRIARATFGTCTNTPYEPALHRSRPYQIRTNHAGVIQATDVFDTWVTKGTIVEDGFSHVEKYRITRAKNFLTSWFSIPLGMQEQEVYIWEGDDPPTWVKDKSGAVNPGLNHVCTVKADVSGFTNSMEVRSGSKGEYYAVEFQVAI